ncbi:MAG: 1-phosphofructokinase family hexose kinase [Puniceicoccaceae bacterium]
MTKVWTLTMNPSIDLGAEVESVVPDVKLRCSAPSIEPGGGGVNVARALRRVESGATAIFPEGAGLGAFYRRLIEEEGVDCRTFAIHGFMHRINNHFRETESRRQYRFNLPGPEMWESEWRSALDLIEDLLEEKDILVMSGSLPPGVPAKFTRLVAETAGNAGALFVLDAPGEVLLELKGAPVGWITPNRKEFEEWIGRRLDGDRLEEELESSLGESAFENVLLTLGSDGAVCASGEEGVSRIRAPEVEKVSAVGAGDSAVAGLVLGLVRGEDHRTACEWAVAAGSAAVMSPGTELLEKENFHSLCGVVAGSGVAAAEK